MKRGSRIVDLAAATGGNGGGGRPGEEFEANGVSIISPLILPATIPVDASRLYSRNVTAFLGLLVKDGRMNVDMSDDIVGPSCVTHEGRFVNQRVAAALEAVSSR